MLEAASLVVCGHDLLSEALPGATLVLDLRSPVSERLEDQLRDAAEALSLPPRYAARAVSRSTWERDVALHATEQSEVGACARVPLVLTVPAPASELACTERFVVRALPYNPLIHIGEGRFLPLSTTAGLEQPLQGLVICAHNVAGAIAGCSWVGSIGGGATVSQPTFEIYRATANTASDVRLHSASAEGTSLEGRQVRLLDDEQDCTCLKHLACDGHVRLRRPDGSVVWRMISEVELPTAVGPMMGDPRREARALDRVRGDR